jgi:hypothetical protein
VAQLSMLDGYIIHFMNASHLLPITFAALGIMTFIWLFLCSWTFKRLEQEHPEKYLEIGEPSLITRNSNNTLLFLRFLFKREYGVLNDASLNKTCNFMRWLFVLYILVFAFLVIQIVTQPKHH